jgi:flagellar basal-body rod modification protein FlgD
MTSPVGSTSALTQSTTQGTTSGASAASAATAGPNAPLGQNAFLKLLMAQLQNQDPLQPTDGTQFVTQLATFSQVEQQVSQSTALTNISNQLSGMSNSNAADLVGKTVTMSGRSLSWDGSFATTANVTLSGPATQVTATISDSNGNVVRTMQLGPSPAGALAVTWNGADGNGNPQPAGTYTVNVSAVNASGQSVVGSQNVTGVVTNVSYDKGYPALTLANGAVAPISQLVSVGVVQSTP